MSLLTLAAQGLLTLGVLAAIAYPLLRRGAAETLSPERGDDMEAAREELLAQKRIAYEAIRELELDRASGKLSETDYQAMRRELEAEAIRVLQRLDALDDPQVAEPAAAPNACPSCGSRAEPEHAYCHKCGASLR